jgi:hypothetical protein
MDALFRYLVRYEVYIYIILGLGAIFALRSVWLSWREWHKSFFGLEKEIAYQRMRTRSVILILLLLIALSQFCIVSFVVPYLPSITFSFTRTPDLLNNNLAASAILQQVETPEPDELAIVPAETGCTPGQITINWPESRQEIRGRIMLIGTVNVENFGFYKYEYRQMGSEDWVTVAANREAKVNDDIGPWDTSALSPGDYELRLVVIENDNDILPDCIIPVRVLEP